MGTPNTITTENFETINSIATIYNYTGAEVAYVDGEMYSYVVTGSTWSIGKTGGPYIKVGANINTLAALLPNYNSNKKNGTITAIMSYNGMLMDQFLYIQFNPSTSIITNISLRDF